MPRRPKVKSCTCIWRGQFALLDNKYTRAMLLDQGYYLYEGTDGHSKALCPTCYQALFNEGYGV